MIANICSPQRHEEGSGEGAIWEFVIVMGMDEGVWGRGYVGGGMYFGVHRMGMG